MNPLIVRRSALLAKKEVTKGTPETLTTADGLFNVYDVDVSEATPYVPRPQQGSFTKLPGVAGAMMATKTFRVHLGGSGATGGVPAWASTFLPACGFDESGGVFTPTLEPANQDTLTMAHYKDGTKQVLSGAMGTFRVVCRNGAPSDVIFTFTGKLTDESDATLLNPTEPTVLPPRGYETFTIDGADVTGPEVTIEAGCQILLIEGKNDATDTGYLHAVVTDFNSTLATEPYAQLNSVKNWRSKFATSVENALSLIVGSDANNTVTIAASKLQLTEAPNFGERVGAYTRRLTFDINDGFTIAIA